MKRFLSLILAIVLLCPMLFACDEKTVLEGPEDIIGEGNADTELELEPALNKKTLELTEGISFERSSDAALKIPTELLDFALELFDKCADDENAVMLGVVGAERIQTLGICGIMVALNVDGIVVPQTQFLFQNPCDGGNAGVVQVGVDVFPSVARFAVIAAEQSTLDVIAVFLHLTDDGLHIELTIFRGVAVSVIGLEVGGGKDRGQRLLFVAACHC